jgi:hypothetical protein
MPTLPNTQPRECTIIMLIQLSKLLSIFLGPRQPRLDLEKLTWNVREFNAQQKENVITHSKGLVHTRNWNQYFNILTFVGSKELETKIKLQLCPDYCRKLSFIGRW